MGKESALEKGKCTSKAAVPEQSGINAVEKNISITDMQCDSPRHDSVIKSFP